MTQSGESSSRALRQYYLLASDGYDEHGAAQWKVVSHIGDSPKDAVLRYCRERGVYGGFPVLQLQAEPVVVIEVMPDGE